MKTTIAGNIRTNVKENAWQIGLWVFYGTIILLKYAQIITINGRQNNLILATLMVGFIASCFCQSKKLTVLKRVVIVLSVLAIGFIAFML